MPTFFTYASPSDPIFYSFTYHTSYTVQYPLPTLCNAYTWRYFCNKCKKKTAGVALGLKKDYISCTVELRILPDSDIQLYLLLLHQSVTNDYYHQPCDLNSFLAESMKCYCSVLFGNLCEVCLLGTYTVVALTALPLVYEDISPNWGLNGTFSECF